MSDLKTLGGIVHDFCTEREWDPYHNLKDLAIGVSTESAELLEIFRFKSEAQMQAMLRDPAAREHIGEELADVLFFLLRLSEKAGIDLEEAFHDKVEKNAAKYPVESARGRNLKYDELP